MKVLFVAGRWAQDIEKSVRLQELRKHAEVELALKGTEEELLEKAGDAEAIITGGPVSAAVIKAAPKLKSRGASTWVTKLDLEHDNIRSAMQWGL